jgi:hypothetical protein
VQAANAKANHTAIDKISENVTLPFKRSFEVATSGAIIGCVLTAEGGCFEGALPGALTGAFGGAIEGTGEAIYSDYIQARAQLKMDLAACPP